MAPARKTHGLGWLVSLRKTSITSRYCWGRVGGKAKEIFLRAAILRPPGLPFPWQHISKAQLARAFPPCSPIKIIESKIHHMDWVGRDLWRSHSPTPLPWIGTHITRWGFLMLHPAGAWALPVLGACKEQCCLAQIQFWLWVCLFTTAKFTF